MSSCFKYLIISDLSESKIKLVKYIKTTDTMVNLDFSKSIYI